jgi:hypothetical protein
MGLDIRLPIGLMFSIFGLLLILYGMLSDKSIYQRSLGININVVWGVVMLGFGALMLILGRRGTAAMRSAESTPEGRATERREHRTGLEHEGGRGH